jgi:hypothetical protein
MRKIPKPLPIDWEGNATQVEIAPLNYRHRGQALQTNCFENIFNSSVVMLLIQGVTQNI